MSHPREKSDKCIEDPKSADKKTRALLREEIPPPSLPPSPLHTSLSLREEEVYCDCVIFLITSRIITPSSRKCSQSEWRGAVVCLRKDSHLRAESHPLLFNLVSPQMCVRGAEGGGVNSSGGEGGGESAQILPVKVSETCDFPVTISLL